MFPTFAEFQQPDPAKLDKTIAAEQVVSWALTQFATVAEIKAALPEIVVIDVEAPPAPAFPIHYVFADRTRATLVVEYTNGELQMYDNPLGVLTNAPQFSWHETNLRNYINLSVNDVPPVKLDGIDLQPIGTGGSLAGMPGDFTPPARFIRATILSQAAPKLETADETVLQAFHVMNQFDLPPGVIPTNANTPTTDADAAEHTQWTVVMDLATPRLYVSTLGNRGIELVDLSQIDQSAGVQHLPLSQTTEIISLTAA